MPTFIQKASAYEDTTNRLSLALGPVVSGDRLVVETSIWGNEASAARVTDSSGDRYSELVSLRGRDGTGMSVWTAPITARTGAHPRITVTPSSEADVGAVAVEYAGLLKTAGPGVVDQIIARSGVTRGRATVSSGATGATTANNELAVGLYADSGFGNAVTPGRGYHPRVDVARTRTEMEQLVEDRIVRTGFRPAATALTGGDTPWTMATIVFRSAGFHGRTTVHAPRSAANAASPSQSGGHLSHSPATPVLPLSRRRRPHPVVGEIQLKLGPQGDFLPVYYCLISAAK
jgi:hypothetical protein